MTVSCREQIMAAALARLQSIVGVTVEQDRAIPIRAEECPLLILTAGAEESDTIFCGMDAYTLGIEVEGYAVGATAAEANAGLGALRAECDRVLLSDITLGGLAGDLQVADEPKDPSLGFDGAPFGRAFVRSYTIRYATKEGDPYAFA